MQECVCALPRARSFRARYTNSDPGIRDQIEVRQFETLQETCAEAAKPSSKAG